MVFCFYQTSLGGLDASPGRCLGKIIKKDCHNFHFIQLKTFLRKFMIISLHVCDMCVSWTTMGQYLAPFLNGKLPLEIRMLGTFKTILGNWMISLKFLKVRLRQKKDPAKLELPVSYIMQQ